MPKIGIEPLRREQIRRAAAQIVATHGFERTTLSMVAKEAGVSTGMINHYYDGKLALMLDVMTYASEIFQLRIKEAIGRAATAVAKLDALIESSVSVAEPDCARGQRIWLWAEAEAIDNRELALLIRERRRLYQKIIADVIQGLDGGASLSAAEVKALAAEYDSYLCGICNHLVTGERNLRATSFKASLKAMLMARLAEAGALQHATA